MKKTFHSFAVMDLQSYMQLSANRRTGMDEHETISDIGQMEFRTIKAAGDTSKVTSDISLNSFA